MLYLHNLHYEKFSDGTVKRIKDKMPFDIPNSWAWVRLSLIFKVINGDRGKNYPAKSSLTSNGIPFISAVNLDGQTVVNDDKLLCLSESQYDKLGSGKLTQGDVVVCIRGSLGKHGIYPFDKGAIASSLVILRALWDKSILSKYLSIYLDSSLFFNEIKKYDNGSAQPNLAANDLEKFFIPIPPEKEMTSLMSTVEGFFTTILNVSDNQNEIEKLIVKLKSKILDLAIKGKLVPQDPTDESASILLERIRKEKEDLIKAGKLKRDKRESVIFRGEDNSYYEKFSDGTITSIERELPFEIPNGWSWCRLKNISTTNIGLTYHPQDVSSTGTTVLRSNNIINNNIDYSELIKVKCTIKENQFLHKNDILICARNGSKNLVGKCAVYAGETNTVSFGAFMTTLRTPFYEYIFNYLQTDCFRRYFHGDDSKQINQVTQEILRESLVPIPPLREQVLITENINKTMKFLDLIVYTSI